MMKNRNAITHFAFKINALGVKVLCIWHIDVQKTSDIISSWLQILLWNGRDNYSLSWTAEFQELVFKIVIRIKHRK